VKGLIILLMAAPAFAQEVRITRSGDGTVVIPGAEGEVTVTTRTVGEPTARRIPREGKRIDEMRLEEFILDRSRVKDEWT
jgi:hypothetical protein